MATKKKAKAKAKAKPVLKAKKSTQARAKKAPAKRAAPAKAKAKKAPARVVKAKAKAKKAPARVAKPKKAVARKSPPPAETLVVEAVYTPEPEVVAEAPSELREIFGTYDRDGSGSIDRGELSRLLEALGAPPSEEELAVALEVVDANQSGKVSFGEFSAWWSSR